MIDNINKLAEPHKDRDGSLKHGTITIDNREYDVLTSPSGVPCLAETGNDADHRWVRQMLQDAGDWD